MKTNNLEILNIGDYVTQNSNFYEYWNCNKIILKVIDKDESYNIVLERDVYFINKDGFPNNNIRSTNKFWEGYFKKDAQTLRKQKLNKINESR